MFPPGQRAPPKRAASKFAEPEAVLALSAISVSPMPKAWFMRRLLNASVVVNSCVVDLDREQARGSLIVSEEAFLRDALDTATAALTAPVSPELLAELPPESPEGGET